MSSSELRLDGIGEGAQPPSKYRCERVTVLLRWSGPCGAGCWCGGRFPLAFPVLCRKDPLDQLGRAVTVPALDTERLGEGTQVGDRLLLQVLLGQRSLGSTPGCGRSFVVVVVSTTTVVAVLLGCDQRIESLGEHRPRGVLVRIEFVLLGVLREHAHRLFVTFVRCLSGLGQGDLFG